MGHENPIESMKPKVEVYNSMYQGVVRNSIDDKELGRVKVEVFPMMKGIPTENLPWAIPKWAGLNRVQIPQEGTTVWVFFQEGDILKPVYESNGLPIKFIEENATTPNPTPEDTHFYEGNDLGDPVYHQEESNRITAEENSSKIMSSEPEIINEAVYPYNDIFMSPGGFVVEFDDTEGYRRYHLYHPSGSFEEINEDGDVHHRAVGDSKKYAEGTLIRYSKDELILQSEFKVVVIAPKIELNTP